MKWSNVLLGGLASVGVDTLLEAYHALDPEAGGKFPYNIQPFPLPNGDDLIQAVIPLGFYLGSQFTSGSLKENLKDMTVGSSVYTLFNLLRMTLINSIYATRPTVAMAKPVVTNHLRYVIT